MFKIFVLLLISASSFGALPPASEVTPSDLPFVVSEVGSSWEKSPTPAESASIKSLFRGPLRTATKTQGTLTVRIESLAAGEKDLKDYFRRWVKEYPKFGYNVLGHKPFKLSGKPAFVVDLTSSTSNKQARQVLTEKDGQVALLTCLDEKDQFSSSLKDCNSIIRNFRWK